MRSLLLMRHAKSAWDTGDADHDRPLNGRGRRAAAAMGRWLSRCGESPAAVLCSSAVRAHSTVQRAADAGDWPAPVSVVPAIYEASAESLLHVVAGAPDSVMRLMLVGHEPGMSQLARLLCSAHLRFPTGAAARIDLDIDTWAAVEPACGQLIWLLPPRLLGDSDDD